MAAQDSEIGVVGRLPDAQAGRGGGLAEAEGTGLGVAAQLPVVQAGLGGNLAAAEKARRVWAKLMLDRCRDLVQHPNHPRPTAAEETNEANEGTRAFYHHTHPPGYGG